jgi:long-chain acyl-CoA synthetase
MTAANNLLEMLEQSVQKFGDRPATYDPGTDATYHMRTYRQLWQDVQTIAHQLSAAGLTAGDRVGLLANSRSWWPICDLAVMSLAACTVPVYPSLPSNQIEFIVQHAGMKGLILQDENQLHKILDIPASEIPELKFLVLLEGTLDESVQMQARERFTLYDYKAWQSAGQTQMDTDVDVEIWKSHWKPLQANDLATIVYTSGTTGQPKGVRLSHGNLLANVLGIHEVVRLLPTDRSLSYLPLSHIFERTCGMFYPLYVGSSVAYSRGFAQIVEDFQQIPPTVLTTVPRLLEKVQETVFHQVENGPRWRQRVFRNAVGVGTKARLEKQPIASWKLGLADRLVFRKIRQALGGQLRAVIVGGAPMPNYIGEFFTAAGLNVAEGYGMTETAPVVSANPPDAPRLGTAGKVLPNLGVRIADDGEVLVRGPSVMSGYYRNDAATEEAFTGDGWLHTGDIGSLTDDGYLKITDRKKNLLVLSTGKKVTPAPIEGEILKNPFVDQVLMIGQSRKYVSIIVVPNEQAVQDRWMKTGKAIPPRSAWSRDADMMSFLMHQVQDCTSDLAKFEQPKKLLIADEAFTVENELLTPSLKVRGKNVLGVYASQIEQMYNE